MRYEIITRVLNGYSCLGVLEYPTYNSKNTNFYPLFTDAARTATAIYSYDRYIVVIASTMIYRFNVFTKQVNSLNYGNAMGALNLYKNKILLRHTTSNDIIIYNITTNTYSTFVLGTLGSLDIVCAGKYLYVKHSNTLFRVYDIDTQTTVYSYAPASTAATIRFATTDGRFMLSTDTTVLRTGDTTTQTVAPVSITGANTAPYGRIGMNRYGTADGLFTYFFNVVACYLYDNTTNILTSLGNITANSTADILSESIRVCNKSTFNFANTTGNITLLTDPTTAANLDVQVSLNFKHDIVLDEQLVASTFMARAYNTASGLLLNEITFTGPTGTILLPDADLTTIVVTPTIGSVFVPNTGYTLGTKVYPTNTNAYPYYFEVTTAGTASVEPVWNVAPGATTVSGTCTFTIVEQIPNASAKFAVVPVPV